MKGRMLFVIAAILLSGTAAYAHHSFAATYNQAKEIKLEGKLVQFLFRNPHAFVQIEAPDENGTMQRWSVEWSGAGQLSEQGVRRDTLRIGDVVTITGNPGRNPADHRLRMNTIRRKSDGFGWGTRPGEVVD